MNTTHKVSIIIATIAALGTIIAAIIGSIGGSSPKNQVDQHTGDNGIIIINSDNVKVK